MARLEKPYLTPMRETVIESGRIRGAVGSNVITTVFKGIPFAAPPVGDLRWRAPQPVEPWEGVRDCTEFSAAAFQLDRSMESFTVAREMYPAPYERSEDCLYLNVWTPAQSAGEKLPVFFWAHGGGNFGGYGHEVENDGEGLAKRGVILVTFNYRLGPLGFLAHPELTAESGTSGNYGLLDAIAALKWTRRNIAAFGGDPDNITIGGQSAGSAMTMCLAVCEETKGMYAKAAFHSGVRIKPRTGGGNPRTLKEAEEFGTAFAAAHGCSTLAQLRALPPEELFRETEFEAGRRMLFRQIVDGTLLTDDPETLIANGEMDDVPCISSCTADEGVSRSGGRQILSEGSRDFCENQLALGRKPAYAFRFSRLLPGDDMGAYHTADLYYLFETLNRCWRPMVGYDYDLAIRFADYWTNFLKTGDPNGEGLPLWTPYTADSRRVMDMGEVDEMMDAD